MLNSELFVLSQTLGKNNFPRLGRAWSTLSKAQQNEIKEIVASLKSEGAICTVYDFVTGAS